MLQQPHAAAVAYARANGYAHVSSSLLYSRYQPHDVIRPPENMPQRRKTPLSEGPRFVYRDFRTDWQAGIDFSRNGAYIASLIAAVCTAKPSVMTKVAAPDKKS